VLICTMRGDGIEVFMLNTHQLNVFLMAAETLNFTQAAQQLEMTQPSVSQHIQSLEERFDIDLFVRSGRSLELTDAGRTLLQMARELVYLSNHIEEAMACVKGDVFGHLMVGCSTTAGRYILPRLLAEFHQGYPQVKATCHVASPEHAAQMLCDGKVHLALTNTPELCREAELRRFLTDEILLVAPLDHPWSDLEDLPAPELLQADFILPEEDSDCYIAVRDALNKIDLSIYQLNNLITLGSPEAVCLSIKEGIGVGFVSNIVVQKLAKGQLKIIPVQGLCILQDVYIGRNPNRPHTAAQNAFWEFVISQEKAILQEFGGQNFSNN
jgi:DNA-binding transcriptional LysR family regulator